jgi:hypothetical protein
MSRPTTKKQIEFVKDVQETFDPAKSVERVYGYKGNAKHVKANKLMKSGNVRELMNDPKVGLTDRHLLDKLKSALSANRMVWSKTAEDWLEDVDWATQIKALELAMKMKGWLSPRSTENDDEGVKEINVTFNLVKARDVDEVKKLLKGTPTLVQKREAVLEKPVEVVPEEKDEKKLSAIEGEMVDDSGF